MAKFPVQIDVCVRRNGRLQEVERLSLPEPGYYSIGRTPESEIQLDSDGVSREHAFLVVQATGLEVIDRASTNGTFIGDEQIDRAPWDGTEPLRIEPFELHLAREGAPIATPPGAQTAALPADLTGPPTRAFPAQAPVLGASQFGPLRSFRQWLRWLSQRSGGAGARRETGPR